MALGFRAPSINLIRRPLNGLPLPGRWLGVGAKEPRSRERISWNATDAGERASALAAIQQLTSFDPQWANEKALIEMGSPLERIEMPAPSRVTDPGLDRALIPCLFVPSRSEARAVSRRVIVFGAKKSSLLVCSHRKLDQTIQLEAQLCPLIGFIFRSPSRSQNLQPPLI